MAQQGRRRRVAAAKATKDLTRVDAATESQHGVAEEGAHGFDSGFVVDAGVFEGTKGVG